MTCATDLPSTPQGMLDRLASENFPPLSRRLASALMDLLGAKVATAYNKVVQGGGNKELAKAWLTRITSICSIQTVETLDRFGIAFDADSVIVLGDDPENGPVFLEVIESLKVGCEHGQEDVTWVMEVLAFFKQHRVPLFEPIPMQATKISGEQSNCGTRDARTIPCTDPGPDRVEDSQPAAMDTDGASGEIVDGSAELAGMYDSHHIYGQSGVLCFSIGNEKEGSTKKTIFIDAAKAKAGGGGYEWKKKVTIRLNAEEIPHFACVMLGMKTQYEGAGHGTAHDKSFSIQTQDNKFFITVKQKNGESIYVPMTLAGAFWVSAMFMRHLSQATQMPDNTILTLLRSLVSHEDNIRNKAHRST